MSGQARRLARSTHRDGLTTHLGALRVYASALGRLGSRDNYTFKAVERRQAGVLFDACTTLQGRSHVGHQRVTYWAPAIVAFGPKCPMPYNSREHERDELDLLVLEYRDRQAIANVRMRCEYGC